jgi:hypothetical protein
VAAASALAAGCGPGGVNRDAYVEKNEDLLASVPILPSAERFEIASKSRDILELGVDHDSFGKHGPSGE